MNDELTLESILSKESGDLTKEEVDHLNEHKSQLTEEQKEKFSSVLTDTDNPRNGDGDKDKENGNETNQ